ncbi:MAG TPA: CoA-binding protein [Burkholderiaceae bacterium]
MDPSGSINDENVIDTMLTRSKTIAVVGMSTDPSRDSYQIGRYLQEHGYRIVPVNPTYSGTVILGERCHASLYEAADYVEAQGAHIDMVDCFRRSDAMEAIADAAIDIGALCLWMQFGVVNQAAANKARAAGMAVVMDRCTKVEHAHRLAP